MPRVVAYARVQASPGQNPALFGGPGVSSVEHPEIGLYRVNLSIDPNVAANAVETATIGQFSPLNNSAPFAIATRWPGEVQNPYIEVRTYGWNTTDIPVWAPADLLFQVVLVGPD